MHVEFPEDREDGESDDAKNNQFEVVLEDRDVAKQVTEQSEGTDPDESADDVVEKEEAVVHLSQPGDERGEGPDDGNEAGDDDRFSAIFFEVFAGSFEVFCVDEGDLTELADVGEIAADPVVECIAEDGSNAQTDEEDRDVDFIGHQGGESAGSEEKRVAGKERHDDQTSLAEDDQEEDDVSPVAEVSDHLFEVMIKVEDEVDPLFEEFHRWPS